MLLRDIFFKPKLNKKYIREFFAGEKRNLDNLFARQKYDDLYDAFLKKPIDHLNL